MNPDRDGEMFTEHAAGRLTAQVNALTAEVARLSILVTTLQDGGPMERGEKTEMAGQAVADVAWKCAKCRWFLGFYDPSTDVLRIRNKDQVSYIRVGVDGWYQTICRGCGELNTQAYASPEEVAQTAAAAEVPRQTRRLVR